MRWLIAPVLGFVAVVLAESPAGAVATMGLRGVVESVGTGISGIAVGNTLSGTVTFDDTDGFCTGACPVTGLSLTLPGGVMLGFGDLQGPATVNVTTLPGSLDALIGVPGSPYEVSDGLLFSGALADPALGPRHFELIGDPVGTTFIANGTLSVTPLPAALPLLATALGAIAVTSRRRGAK